MRTSRMLAVVAAMIVLAALGVAGLGPRGSTPDEAGPNTRGLAGVPSQAGAHTSEPDREPVAQGHHGASATGAAADAAEGGLLVVWARGGLPPGVTEVAAALPDVVAVTRLRSDVIGLVGSRDAAGVVVDAPGDGFRIPVTVLAVDPDTHGAFVGAGDRTAFASLSPGHALLSETSAVLRRIGIGGHLDLEGVAGLEVVGVVPDRTVRGAEVVLHAADADAAGLPPGGALFVAHDAAGEGMDVLAAALEALIPDEVVGRVVDGDVTSRMPLVLPMTEVKRRFGEFAYRPRPGDRAVDIEQAWVDRHIVAARVPLLGTVRCHEAILDDLRAALEDIEEAGLGDWVDPRAYGGCFLARHISTERERLSRHSWGIAIDMNVDLSLPGLGAVPPDGIIEAFGRHGFRWGGDYTTPDNHHWEWVGHAATTRPDRR